MWNPETHPFVARWSHPTGDRLTRFSNTIENYQTREEAIQAISKPFPRNTTDAHVVHFTSPKPGCHAPMIAKRKRGKAIQILEK